MFAAIAGVVIVLSACTPQQNQLVSLTNNSRIASGIRPMGVNAALSIKAQRWAEHTASTGHLAHSNLANGVPHRYRSLGENVGYGSSVGTVYGNLMRSPGHRANT